MTNRIGNKQCVHHWRLDGHNVGHCIKPGCGAVRDFGALLRQKQFPFAYQEQEGQGRRKGRPKKKVVTKEGE